MRTVALYGKPFNTSLNITKGYILSIFILDYSNIRIFILEYSIIQIFILDYPKILIFIRDYSDIYPDY